MRNIIQYIIIIFLSILIVSCGDKKNDSETTKGNKVITKKGKRITDKDHFSFDIIDTSFFYIGKIEEKDFAIKISKSEKTLIQGYLYDLTNTTTFPQSFTISRKEKKCILSTETQSVSFNFEAVHDKTSLEALVFFSTSTIDTIIKIEFSRLEIPEFQSCESPIYKEECYKIEKISDINYANAEGYWCSLEPENEKYIRIITKTITQTAHKKDLALKMDIYRPIEDTLRQHPVILLLHGGAFYIGDKSDFTLSEWCKHFARLGYVAVSINYRMGFKISKKSIQNCGFMAIQDAHAALRYLVHNAELYGIDPNYIFVGGASAGAITALNLVYMSKNSRPESTLNLGEKWSSGNNLTEKFDVRAIINMWGAVYDLNDITLTPTPTISFHGTEDPIIPINYGYPFADISKKLGERLFDEMYGSQAIHQKLDSLKIRNEFYPLVGAKHGPHKDAQNKPTQYFYLIQEKTTHFLYEEITQIQNFTKSPTDSRIYCINNDEIAQLFWKVDGGFIIDYNEKEIKVVWNDESDIQQLTASGFKKNGAPFTKVLQIRNNQPIATN